MDEFGPCILNDEDWDESVFEHNEKLWANQVAPVAKNELNEPLPQVAAAQNDPKEPLPQEAAAAQNKPKEPFPQVAAAAQNEPNEPLPQVLAAHNEILSLPDLNDPLPLDHSTEYVLNVLEIMSGKNIGVSLNGNVVTIEYSSVFEAASEEYFLLFLPKMVRMELQRRGFTVVLKNL